MLFRVFLAVCCAGFASPPPGASIRVGTYNIRLSPGDRETANAWEARKADMVRLIRQLDLDAFGLQEVCPDQARYLRERLAEYAFEGEHREADRQSGEASPVFYRRSRFEAEKRGTFWLSETPDVPASKSWNTACTRVCSYLVLRDRATGRRFCFANTHTDHRSALAREKGMQLIIARMKEFGAGAPIVFTGDHNCTEIESPALRAAQLLDNALYRSEKPASGPWRTWNGWRWVAHEVDTQAALALPRDTRNLPADLMSTCTAAVTAGTATAAQRFYATCAGPRIDYIYVSPGTRVLDYATHGDPRPGRQLYPSDHFPVSATIVLP